MISIQEALDITNFLLILENKAPVCVEFKDPPHPDAHYYPRKDFKVIGVEHTEIIEIPGKRGGNELIRIKSIVKTIFEAARKELNTAGCKQLDVQICFNPQALLQLNKGCKGKEKSIIHAVESMQQELDVDHISFNSRSNEIDPIFHSIDIRRDVSYPRVIISEYSSTIGQVSVLEKIHDAFLRKTGKLEQCNMQSIDEMWLLIVSPKTMYSPEYIDPTDVSFSKKEVGNWDRAFYYDRAEMSITEIILT